MSKRVAFVATGDELIQGQIVDSNIPHFAAELMTHQIQPGRRVTVEDHRDAIRCAIDYLLSDHDALITIGGLGPTCDDLTRFALADALQLPLMFNEGAWQWIVTLLTRKNLKIPENNRQQALFPEGAQLFHNDTGTAAGCYLHHHDKDLFMLPGPPNECRPMFTQQLLPVLLRRHYAHTIYRHAWVLLGANEGVIAAALEPHMKDSGCQLGYRVHYPYLDIKLSSNDAAALDRLLPIFHKLLSPWLFDI